jgi:hypothetical protein
MVFLGGISCGRSRQTKQQWDLSIACCNDKLVMFHFTSQDIYELSTRFRVYIWAQHLSSLDVWLQRWYIDTVRSGTRADGFNPWSYESLTIGCTCQLTFIWIAIIKHVCEIVDFFEQLFCNEIHMNWSLSRLFKKWCTLYNPSSPKCPSMATLLCFLFERVSLCELNLCAQNTQSNSTNAQYVTLQIKILLWKVKTCWFR